MWISDDMCTHIPITITITTTVTLSLYKLVCNVTLSVVILVQLTDLYESYQQKQQI